VNATNPGSDGLPPLNALRAFETAGRMESITAAAAALDVTPGAVSRQVRLLESFLGVPLFDRTGKSVTLTAAGSAYLGATSTHLRAIAAATDQLSARRRPVRLTVRTWTLFATWLIPRLADFRRRNSWIDLRVVASSRRADFAQTDVEVEIAGYDTWYIEQQAGRPLGDPDVESVPIIRSELACMCSPEYRRRHAMHDTDDLKQLGDGELLHSLTAPDLWRRWLAAAGVEGLDSRNGQAYGDSALAAVAARAGHGVAILPRVVFAADLAAGNLVTPLSSARVDGGFAFHLQARPEQLERPHVQIFRNWILEQAALD
jgi:LysR family transcriptional regulator, glycine cleavage system transcriptional activator